jgi:predicted extracellular nuclease
MLMSLPLRCLRRAGTLGLVALLAGCANRSDPTVLTIGAVQGSGEASPLLGQVVAVDGVVNADVDRDLGGFFMQSPQDESDGDAATSDGLFVQWAADAKPMRAGQRLLVVGRVTEIGDGDTRLTALSMAEAKLTGEETVAAAILTGPAENWEALEGMRVRIEAPLTVGRNDELRRYGSVGASFGGRLFQATELARPGDAARTIAADNARRSLVLDDGSDSENPGTIAWLADPAGPLRAGSEFVGTEGVLDQRHGRYRLQQTAAPERLLAAPRPAPPPPIEGALRIAGMNLLNLFNGNGNGHGDGFPTERGARDATGYRLQQAKLVATIQALKPDVAALMEVENDGFGAESALAQLVAALNAAPDNGADWQLVDAGSGPGSDAIRVALIYRVSRVAPIGSPATVTTGAFAHGSRPPLAQSFRVGSGAAFTVVVNHFKSKGSCQDASGADRDANDGQGCWNAARVAAATQLDQWIRTDPTHIGSDHALIIGDLNSYAQEDPIATLTALGWRDALALTAATAPYSFSWNGQAGRLDHALVGPALATAVRGAAEWHNNADEEPGQGYPGGENGPWRASDHDPLVVDLDFSATQR